MNDLVIKQCQTCIYWQDEKHAGTAGPGWSKEHKKCHLKPHSHGKGVRKPWRHPTDSCQDWTGKDVPN